jgi:hypothetical protein
MEKRRSTAADEAGQPPRAHGNILHNVEDCVFVPNVKQVLFFNASVVLLFCCFLKTCFLRKRLDSLVGGTITYQAISKRPCSINGKP